MSLIIEPVEQNRTFTVFRNFVLIKQSSIAEHSLRWFSVKIGVQNKHKIIFAISISGSRVDTAICFFVKFEAITGLPNRYSTETIRWVPLKYK